MLNKRIITKQTTKDLTIQMLKTNDFICLGKKSFGGHMTNDWLVIAQSYNRNVPAEFEGVGG